MTDAVFGGTVLFLAGLLAALLFDDRTRAERIGLLCSIVGCAGLAASLLAGASSTVVLGASVGALVLSLTGLLTLGRIRSAAFR